MKMIIHTFIILLFISTLQAETSHIEIIKECGTEPCKKDKPTITVQKDENLNADRRYDTGKQASGLIGSFGCSSLDVWCDCLEPTYFEENPPQKELERPKQQVRTCSLEEGPGCRSGIIPVSEVVDS